MLRMGNIIGLTVGGLFGYLCSFDIDTSLGAAKVPVYVGTDAFFGWLTGFAFYMRAPSDCAATARVEGERAAAAEAEVQRLRARVAELERDSHG